jgi:hypothetical protein
MGQPSQIHGATFSFSLVPFLYEIFLSSASPALAKASHFLAFGVWRDAAPDSDGCTADSLVEIDFGLLVFRQLANFNHAAAIRLAC